MLSVYNSLTKKLEPFEPTTKKEVSMYHCGPTVYDYAHIGNLRSYVFADILRRTCEYMGLRVKQVVNITDIGHLTSDADSGDDKMVKGLKRENLPLTLDGLKKLADKYEQAFKEDLLVLNIETPHHFPRATKYLEQEIDLVKKLEEKGFTYTTSDGVYFDTSKDPNYGKLGGTGGGESRIAPNSEKKNPKDFVLWKLSKDNHLGFPSPWGKGFPGWHIECSAMSRELLGQPFDIHTGGIDHIPVHHNNEIAQSEAAYGQPLANYWLHNEFVIFNDSKMAKSEGNIVKLKDLVAKGFSPLAYRYFLLLSHYRTQTNFTEYALAQAGVAYRQVKELFNYFPKGGKIIQDYQKEFTDAIENDLNTAQAIGILWNLLRTKNESDADKRATLADFDKILGLDLEHNEFEARDEDISAEVRFLIHDREEARANKDFKKSDQLRDEIKTKGFAVEDTDTGPKISRI